jgi:xylulokinase
MQRRYLMGIDLGTSSVKVIVMEREGQLVSSASTEYSFDIPHPGWAEQNPQSWVDATLNTMKQAVLGANLAANSIEAIGLSGQMHGLVCVDAGGAPVRPAILWPDQRSAPQVQQVYRVIGAKRLGEWTANPVAAGFMLPSWLWLVENEPKTVERTRSLILPKDALRFALTGQLGVEPSDASSTLLFDTFHRTWSLELAQALEINSALLPPLHESVEAAGGLNGEVAKAVGLTPGIPVIYGGSDQSMAALGQGIIRPGLLLCSVSTGGQMLAPLQAPLYDSQLRTHTFCHVLKDHWYMMAATLSAGLSLKWLRDNLFMNMTYTQLADLAAEVPSSEGLYFLPHLAGERTPYMDAGSKAGLWGLTLHHSRNHIVRAVMEGVIFSMRLCLDLFQKLGVPVQEVLASGGGVRHPLWLRLMADIFGQPIYQAETVEASATGAAILAGISVGAYLDAQTACQQVVHRSSEIVQPDQEAVERYRASFVTYCKLYPAFNLLRDQGNGEISSPP